MSAFKARTDNCTDLLEDAQLFCCILDHLGSSSYSSKAPHTHNEGRT